MFLSQRWSGGREEPPYSHVGTVSLGGQQASVVSAGQQNRAAVFGPGGMCWVPKRGQSVLVIKAGGAGEEPCIAGVQMEIPGDMEPGEVYLYSEGASLWLKNDGRVLVTGRLVVNGQEVV